MGIDAGELEEILSDLGSADVAQRVAMLSVLESDPTSDPTVRERIKALLEDNACAFVAPGYVTEVKWFAAKAFAAELKAAALYKPFELHDMVVPVQVATLMGLAEDVFGEKAADMTLEQRFDSLREQGHLEMKVCRY